MSKALDLERLKRVRESCRKKGETVVFTNGCFDLLHRGHIHLFETAKGQGDILVVAVNTDASIRRLKGEHRPIFPLQERLEILEALEAVDYLIAFDEDTPLRLITQLQPDVLVKGGDWKPEEVVGRAEVAGSGGRLVLVPFLAGFSSSRILERIKNLG